MIELTEQIGIIILIVGIKFPSCSLPSDLGSARDSLSSICCGNEIFCPNNFRIKIVDVIKPIPPMKISIIIMIWPNVDQN